ncbi:MAG TPA: class I SAM-dependent methyltransferase [Caldilineaceae bacterium]|nr:class I SAM-dependent methyltransferase [Caldilineaceae bacterium]
MVTPNLQHSPTWFEKIYRGALHHDRRPPWSVMRPRPAFLQWAERTGLTGDGQRAAVIGCGLGDDAEELARRGFQVTAFDIAPTAVTWCRQRFSETSVHYQVADLFAPPATWIRGYDFVLEIFTIQALPIDRRIQTIDAVANLVAPGGLLFVFTLGADCAEGRHNGPPWSLTKGELAHFAHAGLTLHHFEELRNFGAEPNLRFRATYGRDIPHA